MGDDGDVLVVAVISDLDDALSDNDERADEEEDVVACCLRGLRRLAPNNASSSS